MIDSICNNLRAVTDYFDLDDKKRADAFYEPVDVNLLAYHYTTPEAFLKIVENGKLWFTRSDCLNDFSEGQYILTVFKDVLEKMHQERQDEDFEVFYKNANYELGRGAFHSSEGLLPKTETHHILTSYDSYVCCLSTEEDSLQMWNYYMKANAYEGYNIGFRIPSMFTGGGFRVVKVLYSYEEQCQLMQTMIEEVLRIYGKNCCMAIHSFLSDWRLMFKHEAFRHEQEVRVLLRVPHDKSFLSQHEIKFRSQHGFVAPYIEVEFNKESIFRVTIGPVADSKFAAQTCLQFLAAEGFSVDRMNSPVEVWVSDIPVRF